MRRMGEEEIKKLDGVEEEREERKGGKKTIKKRYLKDSRTVA